MDVRGPPAAATRRTAAAASPHRDVTLAHRPALSAPPLPAMAAVLPAGPQDDLPLDYQYTWAQDSYSRGRRTADTWAFVLTLRARLWLQDQAWSYGPGGMTAERKAARGRVLAAWIRESLLQLGPTYIKVRWQRPAGCRQQTLPGGSPAGCWL